MQYKYPPQQALNFSLINALRDWRDYGGDDIAKVVGAINDLIGAAIEEHENRSDPRSTSQRISEQPNKGNL